MIFWRNNNKPDGPIYDWLLANKDAIRDGTAEFMGSEVNETTELCQYKYVVSFGVATLAFVTPHFIPSEENGYLKNAHWKYTLITAALGWWGFPWGPPFTIHSIGVNLRGGKRRNVASLLQLLEWGWDAPGDVSVIDHKKEIVDISDGAAEEIRLRKAKGGFPDNVGVRITPAEWAHGEVQIAFDYPVSDGRDWIDESQGMVLLIDKKDEPRLWGCRIDFVEGAFRRDARHKGEIELIARVFTTRGRPFACDGQYCFS